MEQITYATAGVDTQAGDRAVDLMKAAVAQTHTSAVFGGQGGFAGMVDVSELKQFKQPLLATSTDGVGTKVAIAQALDIHDTIGQDLVAMVVDDIVVVGARPLLMTDYIACGKVYPQRIADIVRGIAQACTQIKVPLLGGETAEHPGLLEPDEYDVAGAATGVVEADLVLGPQRVRAGDVLVALGSSGLHSNGYSLIRAIMAAANWDLGRQVSEFSRTLGEELLEPTRLYTAMCLEMIERIGVGHQVVDAGNSKLSCADQADACGCAGERIGIHALSHITGGGLGANLSRVLPANLCGVVDRASWPVPPVFEVFRRLGQVPWNSLEDTLNLGVGMVVVAGPDSVSQVCAIANAYSCEAWVLGQVVPDLNKADSKQVGSLEYSDLPVSDLSVLPEYRRISGTKGVQAGSAVLHGKYRV